MGGVHRCPVAKDPPCHRTLQKAEWQEHPSIPVHRSFSSAPGPIVVVPAFSRRLVSLLQVRHVSMQVDDISCLSSAQTQAEWSATLQVRGPISGESLTNSPSIREMSHHRRRYGAQEWIGHHQQVILSLLDGSTLVPGSCSSIIT